MTHDIYTKKLLFHKELDVKSNIFLTWELLIYIYFDNNLIWSWFFFKWYNASCTLKWLIHNSTWLYLVMKTVGSNTLFNFKRPKSHSCMFKGSRLYLLSRNEWLQPESVIYSRSCEKPAFAQPWHHGGSLQTSSQVWNCFSLFQCGMSVVWWPSLVLFCYFHLSWVFTVIRSFKKICRSTKCILSLFAEKQFWLYTPICPTEWLSMASWTACLSKTWPSCSVQHCWDHRRSLTSPCTWSSRTRSWSSFSTSSRSSS